MLKMEMILGRGGPLLSDFGALTRLTGAVIVVGIF